MAHQNLIPRGLTLNESSSLHLLVDDSIVCSELALVQGQSRLVHRLYARQTQCPTFGGVGWIIDDDISACMVCNREFGFFFRKHHCRSCGDLVCYICSPELAVINEMVELGPQRVCVQCYWGQYPVHAARSRAPAATLGGSVESGLVTTNFEDEDGFTAGGRRSSFSKITRRRSLDPGSLPSSIPLPAMSPPPEAAATPPVAQVRKASKDAYNSDDETQSDSDESSVVQKPQDQDVSSNQLSIAGSKNDLASLEFEYFVCGRDNSLESAMRMTHTFSFNEDASMAEILSSLVAFLNGSVSSMGVEVHALLRSGSDPTAAFPSSSSSSYSSSVEDAQLPQRRVLDTPEAISVLEKRSWGHFISSSIKSIEVLRLFAALAYSNAGKGSVTLFVTAAPQFTNEDPAAASKGDKDGSSLVPRGTADSVSISKEALSILMSLDLSRNASAAEDPTTRRRSKRQSAMGQQQDPGTPARASILSPVPETRELHSTESAAESNGAAMFSPVKSMGSNAEVSTVSSMDTSTTVLSVEVEEAPPAPLNISEEDKALLSYALSGGVSDAGGAVDSNGIAPLVVSSGSVFDMRSPVPSSGSQAPAAPRESVLAIDGSLTFMDDEILRSDFDILGSISIGRFLQCFHIKKHLKEGYVSESDIRHIFSRFAEVRKRGSSMSANGGVAHKTTAELIGLKAFVQAVEAVAEEADAERIRRETRLKEMENVNDTDVSNYPEELCDAFKQLAGENNSDGVTLEALCLWAPIQDAVAEGILEGNAIENRFQSVCSAGALTLPQFVKLSEILQKLIDEKLMANSLNSYRSHLDN